MYSLNYLLILFCAALFCSQAQSQTLAEFEEENPQTCFDGAIGKKLSQKYNVDLTSFEINPADIDQALCDSKSDFRKLIESLWFIENLQLSPFSGGIVRSPYPEFVLDRTTSIERSFTACGGPASDALACHRTIKSETWIRTNFFTQSAMNRATTLIHEARHGDNFDHVTCTRGLRNGSAGSCDENFEQGGAYAAGNEFLARLYFYGMNVYPLIKTIAKEQLLLNLESDFNQVPTFGNQDNWLLALTNEGKILSFDGAKWTDTAILLPNYRLACVGANNEILVMVNEQTKDIQAIQSETGIISHNVVKNSAAEKLLKTINLFPFSFLEKNSRIIDTIPTTAGNLFLYEFGTWNMKTAQMHNFAPKTKPLFLSNYSPCQKTEAAYVAIQKNSTQKVLQKIDGTGQDCNLPSEYKQIKKIKDIVFVLKTSGDLVQLSGDGKELPINKVAGNKFQQIVITAGTSPFKSIAAGGDKK